MYFVVRSFVGCCAAALLLVPAAPAGSDTPPRLGMYHCFSSGTLAFSGMLKLESSGWYVTGEPDASRTRITRVTGRGTYRMAPLVRNQYGVREIGTRITFLRGYLRHFDGRSWYRTGNMFNIELKRDPRYGSLCRLRRSL